MPRPRDPRAGPTRLAPPPDPGLAPLLDLGAQARGWLGTSALRSYDVITVEPPAADPLCRPGARRDGRAVQALPDRLPFADGVFAAAVVADVVEHVRDDLDALDEIARVLRPGGTLILRTPRAGPLTWLDPYNLHRYAAEATGHEPLFVESGGLGWRRHYRRDELAALLAERGLDPIEATGAGLGFAEAVVVVVLVLCRLVLRSERAESVAFRALRPLIRAEANLPAGRFGYDLVIRARRSVVSPIAEGAAGLRG